MDKNPIVEVYKGVNIRRCNQFQIRLSAVVFKLLILESERTGMPISKILAISSKPCERCSPYVAAFNKEDDEVKIKRGILFTHMTEGNSGTSRIKQVNAKTK